MRAARRGVLLLEVLLAGLLLATTIGGLALASTLHEQALSKHGNRAAARQFAQEELERCVAEGFQGVDDYASAPVTHELVWRLDDGSVQSLPFHCQVTVTQPDDEVKDVVVAVTYPDRKGPLGKNVFRLGTSLFWSE